VRKGVRIATLLLECCLCDHGWTHFIDDGRPDTKKVEGAVVCEECLVWNESGPRPAVREAQEKARKRFFRHDFKMRMSQAEDRRGTEKPAGRLVPLSATKQGKKRARRLAVA